MTPDAPFYSDVCSAPDGQTGWWVKTVDGIRLRVMVWTGGQAGTAIVFPGRTEYCEKYAGVISKLVGRGLSVVVIDWRGQGLSDRLPGADEMGHVGRFADYQHDVAAVMELVGHLDLPRPFWMVAHSMGGCIGLRTLLDSEDFSGAIFSAPMWRLQIGTAIKGALAKAGLSKGGAAADAVSGHPGETDTYPENVLTSDRELYELGASQIKRHPDLITGPPSVRWTIAAIVEMERMAYCRSPKLPFLTFLGTEEKVVSQTMIKRRMAAMPNGKLAMCPGGRHEVFVETPQIRELIWNEIDRFLDMAQARTVA